MNLHRLVAQPPCHCSRGRFMVPVGFRVLYLIGPKNVLAVTYDNAQDDELGRHDGTATIRCLNAAVYTHWTVEPYHLGKIAPHTRSISGAAPVATAQAQDLKPTREIIAGAITALKNESTAGPSFQQLETSFQQVELKLESHIETSLLQAESRLKDHLDRMGNTVNKHTTTTMDTVNEQNKTNHAFLLHHVQLLTAASQEYTKHMSGISTALLNAQSSSPQPRELARNAENDS